MKNFKLGLFGYMVKKVGMKCAIAESNAGISGEVADLAHTLTLKEDVVIWHSLNRLRSKLATLTATNDEKRTFLTSKIDAAIAALPESDTAGRKALANFQKERASQFETVAQVQTTEVAQVKTETHQQLMSHASDVQNFQLQDAKYSFADISDLDPTTSLHARLRFIADIDANGNAEVLNSFHLFSRNGQKGIYGEAQLLSLIKNFNSTQLD
ncbi:MAG: hypothetical protein PHH70_04185, partial [Candidatus Gracilibacteria bacterium]|nr:hypothetical protein [Candidatus Gracilibacteria bacterium]